MFLVDLVQLKVKQTPHRLKKRAIVLAITILQKITDPTLKVVNI